MMNIFVCINLLLSACVSVCLTASLSDDQLAQIISERLQTDPLTESREYASAEDINEFEKRLAALEKLDEVTGKLFPDNTPTEYSDGPMQHRRGILRKTLKSSTDVNGHTSIDTRSNIDHISKSRITDKHASVLQSNTGRNEIVEVHNVRNGKEKAKTAFLPGGGPCPLANCHKTNTSSELHAVIPLN